MTVPGVPRGIAFEPKRGWLWIAQSARNYVVAVDPEAGEIVDRVRVAEDPREVRVGEGLVWVTSAEAGTVTAIDPSTLEPAEVAVRGRPYGLGVGFGRAWAASLAGGRLVPVKPRP